MQKELPQHELREETPTACVLTVGLIEKGNRDFLAVGEKNEDSQKKEERECTWVCSAGSGLKFLAGPRLQRSCLAGQRPPGDSDPEFAEDPAVWQMFCKNESGKEPARHTFMILAVFLDLWRFASAQSEEASKARRRRQHTCDTV